MLYSFYKLKRLKTLTGALLLCQVAYSQQVIYNSVFAPSEKLVKPAEKPYRQEICLNGLWQFQPVALPASFREGTDPAPELPGLKEDGWDKVPVRVPSPWNVNSFADKNGQGGDFRTFPSYPKVWENIKMGWLRKKFVVPANWQDKRLIIHFDAVAGDAVILINGKQAGKHFGIFLPFDIDVTHLVTPGKENEIALGIRKSSLFDQRGPYGRRTYQAGSFWGQHTAGIWQDVNLEAVPQVHITDVFIKPKVSADELEAEVTIRNDGRTTATVSLESDAFKWMARQTHSVDDDAQPCNDLSPRTSLTLPAKTVKIQPQQQLTVLIHSKAGGHLSNWSPENPNLYGLITKVLINGKAADAKYTRFGWREITISNGNVLLNGKRVVLKGDSWHFLGIPQMTRRYAAAWYHAMRDAHLNTVRLHAEPYPSFYLDVADEMGILVLDESAIWASDGGPKLDAPSFWSDTESHLAELVNRDRNHPSVFGWSVSNEVMPIVTNVFRNPPGMRDTLIKHYGMWASICRKYDSTRPWISADGEDDGQGNFPAYVIHYGGPEELNRGKRSGKPWGVGEAGNAYYGTPEQVAATNGNRAYESFLGRMEGVAQDSYRILLQQRECDASYRSVFNLVWYGLKPLPLGLKDLTKAPDLNDGIRFTSYKEGMPGVQPERLGPYSTTLNPGYDPSLPLYQTWPLFDAIRDANAETLPSDAKWTSKKNVAAPAEPKPPVKSVLLIAGPGSTLSAELKRTGVLFEISGKEKVPAVLFVDGIHPPAGADKSLLDKVFARGGTVIIWGAEPETLLTLNALLPAPLAVTARSASSFLPVTKDQLISGLGAADLYFSELNPHEVTTTGLSGALTEQSIPLLAATATDWTRWNSQPEYAKTGMIVRSERETHPSGITLIRKQVGQGNLIVTTLPPVSKLPKVEKMIRQILTNAGVSLEAGNDTGHPLLKDGTIVRGLYLGNFSVASLQDGAAESFVDPAAANKFKSGEVVDGKNWIALNNENPVMDLSKVRPPGPGNNTVVYLSFWILSPRSLEDLLVEPNIPVVNLEVSVNNAVQVYLNGKAIINNVPAGGMKSSLSKAEALKLRQGWNNVLIKLIQTEGHWQFSGQLTSNQPEFLSTLTSSLEKP